MTAENNKTLSQSRVSWSAFGRDTSRTLNYRKQWNEL